MSLVADKAFEARASERTWGAAVTVEMTDGTIYTVTKEDACGGGDTPFTRKEIYDKFNSLGECTTSIRCLKRSGTSKQAT